MARIGARPGDWKTLPLPGRVAALPFTRTFSVVEFTRLQQGLVPEEMEDKWFVVWHVDALWLHRGWTGFCIYRVSFAVEGDEVKITEVIVNREPEQYIGSDKDDPSRLGNVLDTVLSYSAPAKPADEKVGIITRLRRALSRS